MDNVIRIRITHAPTQDNSEGNREAFWEPFRNEFQKRSREYNWVDEGPSPSSYEEYLRRDFGAAIGRYLSRHFSRVIDTIDSRHERYYYRDRSEAPRGKYDPDDFRSILYQKDAVYRDAIAKSILSSQIMFNVNSIQYGSLNIDVVVEPIDKFLDVFDNNFDLMRIFFESYVPEAFLGSLDDHRHVLTYRDVRLSFDYDFPESFKRQPNRRAYAEPTSDITSEKSNKLDKAKWLTGLMVSPMLFPFLLALAILYFAYQKIDAANKIYLEQNQEIQKQKDEVIDSYKGLLQEYKVKVKTDTASRKK